MTPTQAVLAGLVLVGVAVAIVVRVLRSRTDLGTPADRATFATLHTASLAAPHLRDGLTAAGATRAARHLRALLGTPAVALTAGGRLLAWDGIGAADHAAHAAGHAEDVVQRGRAAVLSPSQVACQEPTCPVQHAVVVPLVADERVVGALAAYGPRPSAGLVRAAEEVASWVSANLDLAELDRSRTRMIEAELRALRAQISPHFVYNSLTAIASFVRTDPDRARDLLLEFADFTRYAFRRGGEFTTLADELTNIERYLVLEKARFGDRLDVRLRVAPEVLQVSIPFLSVQPLVENAVRHGIESSEGVGHVTLTAEDVGTEALISVEDDGVGSDPDDVRRALSGETGSDSVGLGNVDSRLRQVFGDDAGLVVETAPGAGPGSRSGSPSTLLGPASDEPPPAPDGRTALTDLLRVLVVDDEAPALAELAWLLKQDARVGDVVTAGGATEALRLLDEHDVDAVFCDIKMPGLDGLDLARVLARFSRRPQIVFVTAYDRHAVDAFELGATDYLMKPVRSARLSDAIGRVVDGVEQASTPGGVAPDETIPVELGGVTRFVRRSQVRYVEAHGDYARLHTEDGTHLIRVPLSTLEERWEAAGFVRIHRSTLVSLPHVEEVRTEGGRCSVLLAGVTLAVSRRHTRELRESLLRARAGA